MRNVIATAALVGAVIASAAMATAPRRAHAQTLDRYGGTSAAYAQAQYAPAPYAQPAYGPPQYAQAAPSPYPQPAYAQAQSAPTPYAPPPYAAPQGGATAGLRTLNWPGRIDAPPSPQPAFAPAPQYAPQPYATPAYAARQAYAPPQTYPQQGYPQQGYAPPQAYAPQAYAAQPYAAPAYPAAPMAPYAPNPGATLPYGGGVQPQPTVLRPVPAPIAGVGPAPYGFAQPAAAAYTPMGRAPAPTSIYSDAAATTPAYGPVASVAPYGPYVSAQAQAAAQGQSMAANQAALTPAQRAAQLPPPSNDSPSRLYSLHREYGMTPDAAPIAPAFFTASADLTTPETPDVTPRNGSTASKAAQNAARIAAGAGQ